jgi:hypothetical protein
MCGIHGGIQAGSLEDHMLMTPGLVTGFAAGADVRR